MPVAVHPLGTDPISLAISIGAGLIAIVSSIAISLAAIRSYRATTLDSQAKATSSWKDVAEAAEAKVIQRDEDIKALRTRLDSIKVELDQEKAAHKKDIDEERTLHLASMASWEVTRGAQAAAIAEKDKQIATLTELLKSAGSKTIP